MYDTVIVGGGPAGLTAAVYCMRKGLAAGIIIKDMGGQVAETAGIENYLGFRYVNGAELVDKFREQVLQFGIAFREGATVTSIQDGSVKRLVLDDGTSVSTRTVIIASGKSWRRLGVKGERELTGRGVAYCSTCDAPFFAGKDVAVVGGGNSGIESAIDLAKVASRVVLVQNLDSLTADRILVDRLGEYGNVEIIYGHGVTEILGEERVRGVSIRSVGTGETRNLEVQGIFIEIGLVPNSGFVKGLLEMNESGEIVVDSACATSRPGIFAAGDVTSVPFKQIIIAGGEGAKAALSAAEYILTQK
ncbi:MAG: FAD-dependent oxidoreductase [Spirochaetes bacterium]|nr:FAD-dependent oxidoreductase [Spirochaetota bacterium]